MSSLVVTAAAAAATPPPRDAQNDEAAADTDVAAHERGATDAATNEDKGTSNETVDDDVNNNDDDDDDDAPVYLVGAVTSVAEAVALVRTSPLSAHERAAELTSRARDYPYTHYTRYTAAAARPRDLPATLHAFRACAGYTAMLTVTRRAVLDDALHGFAGEVTREAARLQRLRDAPEQHSVQKSDDKEKENNNNDDDDDDDSGNGRTVRAQDDAYTMALRERAFADSRLPHFVRYTQPQHEQEQHAHDGNNSHSSSSSNTSADDAGCAQAVRVRREWVFVWRQMTRDLHREVLLVDSVAYNEPTAAGAAIVSFLDSCYTRGQCAAEARLAALVYELDATTTTRTRRARTADSRSSDNNNDDDDSTHTQHEDETAAASQSPTSVSSSAHKALSRVWQSVRRVPVVRAAVAHARAAVATVVERHASLVATTQRERAVRRVRALYPREPCARAAKVYAAAREVVLAAQQSFLAFPYQLLYEQVGMHRFACAQDTDEGEGNNAQQEQEKEQSGYASTNGNDADTSSPRTGVAQPTQRCRESCQPPLVIGEPSMTELTRFMAVVRARVLAYDARHAAAAAAHEQHEHYKGSDRKEEDNNNDNTTASLLFRESVDGSVYLLPLPVSAEADSDATPPPPQRGTRIHLYYSEARGVPVVCVSKLFSLRVPLTHSSCAWPQRRDEADDSDNNSSSSSKGASHATTAAATADAEPEQQVVLLLMQIHFSLFTEEEVEVRWRWHVL